VQIARCSFTGNIAARAAGVMADQANLSLDRCLEVFNCVIAGNQAADSGGIGVHTNYPCAFKSCTIAGNAGGTTPGLYASACSELTVTNCIVWANGTSMDRGLSAAAEVPVTITYCCTQIPWPGQGNLCADPYFADADGPDDTFGTADDDLRLTRGSPCIDAGCTSQLPDWVAHDLGGHAWREDGGVDMGAYECADTVLWYVDQREGSDDYTGADPSYPLATIQAAIHRAGARDTILVWPGTYTGPISFEGKAIRLRGVPDADGTPILTCPVGPCVVFDRSEMPDSIMSNFLVEGGQDGISIGDSACPTLRNLTVVGNHYGIRAAGNACPDIDSCIFWGNSASDLSGCQASYSWVEQDGGIDLRTGLVNYWPMDPGPSGPWVDVVGGCGGSGVRTTQVGGVVNRAVVVNDNGRIRMGHSPALEGMQSISIGLWARVGRPPYPLVAVEHAVGLSLVRDLHIGIDSHWNLRVLRSDRWEHTFGPIVPNRWTHIVITEDKPNCILTVYVDGMSLGSCQYGTTAKSHSAGAYLVLGSNAAFDEVVLYNRLLSAREIQRLHLLGRSRLPVTAPALSDPGFADPDGGDYHLRSEQGRYLEPEGVWVTDDDTSPCVNSGNPLLDASAEPAPNGGRLNMGVYGGSAYAGKGQ
jgi:hypothetical protein